jgi:dTDP-N-acetylfucosamine:lipid II N-acetylfucosaminyltransferase
MILHIVIDDKFIDAAYRIFEQACPGNNEFLLVTNAKKFQYIKKTPIRTMKKIEFFSHNFAKTLVQYEMVILHWLDEKKLQLIAKAPVSVKFVWIGWGGDYYDRLVENHNQLLPRTKTIFDAHVFIKKKSLGIKILNIVRNLIYKTINTADRSNLLRLVNRIDYFCPVLIEDYCLVVKSVPNFKPKYLSWNCGTLEDDLIRGFENSLFTSNNILIGNSATYSNNHLDIFEKLLAIKTDERLIICPLSYGDLPIYRDAVIEHGNLYWGDKFVPMVDFIPIENYIELISSCSVVIMNHLRQQAVGNIVSMMYLGAKIFLNNQNPVYQFFKKTGAYIYSIESLNQEINLELSQSQVEHNRNILRRHWGRDVILAKTKALISTVSKN